MGIQTNQVNAVEVLITTFFEVGAHVPVFHPWRHDAKARGIRGIRNLDSNDCQDVGIRNVFGNQHLLTEPLRVT